MWIVFHFLLTRRTDQLVRAAEQLAAGNLAARSALRGRDELARLSRAFDVMADEVAQTQTHLQEDIAKRIEVQQALRASEEQYRAMFDASRRTRARGAPAAVRRRQSGAIEDVRLQP